MFRTGAEPGKPFSTPSYVSVGDPYLDSNKDTYPLAHGKQFEAPFPASQRTVVDGAIDCRKPKKVDECVLIVHSAKGGVEGLTRSLAAELAPAVRVNCLAPALTDTPLAASFFSSPEICLCFISIFFKYSQHNTKI